MKIQIITDRKINQSPYKKSSLNDIDTLDTYDYNIIDLNSKNIWECVSDCVNISNKINDLKSIGEQIKNSKKAKTIIVFPNNHFFDYNYDYYDRAYTKKLLLRDNIRGMSEIISPLIGENCFYTIKYEKNHYILNSSKLLASFYFSDIPSNSRSIIKSIDSEKIISFSCGNNTYTTIDIIDQIDSFVSIIDNKNIVEYPNWFNNIVFNDDNALKETINKNNTLIESLNSEIEEANFGLSKNNYYKSILFENGENLVKIVFDILQQIIGIDLSNFVDEKKEDFNFVLDNIYYVGEIKGVNECIKRKHLSELEDHKQDFIDDNDIDFAKGLLIINQQRQTEPNKRAEVHPNQIEYAVKDELLIIESTTLLHIYESFLKNELDVTKLKSILLNNTGILKDEWR